MGPSISRRRSASMANSSAIVPKPSSISLSQKAQMKKIGKKLKMIY
jgi:hypothetical protein